MSYDLIMPTGKHPVYVLAIRNRQFAQPYGYIEVIFNGSDWTIREVTEYSPTDYFGIK